MTDSEVIKPLVLIIDDDQTVHLWAKRHLSFAGFRLISALNGYEGIELFKSHLPNIVLIDVEMPDIDGFLTCSKIRKLPESKNTPILIVTGTEDAERVASSFSAGATDFVVKPVNWKVLIHRINYMIKASNTLQQLEKSQIRLSKAQEMAKLGHWEFIIANKKLYWSDETYTIFQKNPATFTPDQSTFLELVHPSDKSLVEESINKSIHHKKSVTFDYRINTATQEERFVEQQIEVVLDTQNQLIGLTGTIQDISERKAHEKQVRYLAYYDEITGLPNRACFLEFLTKNLELSKRNKRNFAILFMDLDGFKGVNDSLGHHAGDLLLKEVAKRITEGLRHSDITSRCTIPPYYNIDMARLGGDEFTILLNELAQPQDAEKVAQNIQKWLADPILIHENRLFIGASIGISLYPQDGDNCETLLKNADIAMYHAKKTGKGSYQFFHESMNIQIKRRHQIEYLMRFAVANNELRLYYQPIVNAVSGLLIGAEALMRWESPQLGFLLPADFLPLAEENGFVIKFGEWAIREVCRQYKLWQMQGMGHLSISVNVSGLQFYQENFISTVKNIIDEFQVAPDFLIFELTETLLMTDTKKVVNTLQQLKEIGIKLSIDDFGTGYSSLSYLKNFPLDSLKIDRSFIKNLPVNLDDAAIVKAILMLANTLSLHTVAEGVETIQQRDFMIQNTCEAIQGYLFAKPMPMDDFKKYWAAEVNKI